MSIAALITEMIITSLSRKSNRGIISGRVMVTYRVECYSIVAASMFVLGGKGRERFG